MNVLLVCLGNICRSPTAEAVLRARLAAAGCDVGVDSAGTGGWHVGAPPDPRALAAAAARGYAMDDLRARRITRADFARFDLILAMDRANLLDVERLRPAGSATPVTLFCAHATGTEAEVPDPYQSGSFGPVLDMIEAGAAALVARWAG